MKKIWVLLLLPVLVVCMCGCEQISTMKEAYSIAPASLSEETRSILNALGDDTLFFDYKVSADVRSFSLDIWTCTDGVWKTSGAVSDNIGDSREGRIGIRATPTSFDVITLDSSGYTRYSGQEGINFSEVTATSMMQTNETKAYNLDMPVTLMVRVGTNASEIRTFDLDDFQNMDCEIGYAFTLTFFEEPLK